MSDLFASKRLNTSLYSIVSLYLILTLCAILLDELIFSLGPKGMGYIAVICCPRPLCIWLRGSESIPRNQNIAVEFRPDTDRS